MNWFILAFISAIFSAAAAVSEKKSLFSLDAVDFSFIVSLVTLIFSIPFFFSLNFSHVTAAGFWILFFKTMLGAGAFLCVMYSIKNLEISEALPLLALSPALVAIGGVLFINDSLSTKEWIGISLMVAGAYILESGKGSKSFAAPFKALFNFRKYSFVFIALILFAVTSLLDRILLTGFKLPPYTFMAFQQLFYTLFFAVLFFAKRRSLLPIITERGKEIFYLIIAVSVFTVIYRYTQIEATKAAPVALVLSVKRLSVLFAVIFGGSLFREKNLYGRIAAVVIILAGATLLFNNG